MKTNTIKNIEFTILVIDDHHLIQTGTTAFVQEHYPNAKIITASTAEEALQKIANNDINLTIVDLSIPEKAGMNAHLDVGINLLQELMKNHPNLNIMVQSSNVKALNRIKKHYIDHHQGGFTIADKSLSVQTLLTRLDWALEGLTYTKSLNTDLAFKPEWLEVLQLAFEEGLQDKAIAQNMYKSERMIRHYWCKIQDALEIYPEEGKNLRALTQIKAREEGLIN